MILFLSTGIQSPLVNTTPEETCLNKIPSEPGFPYPCYLKKEDDVLGQNYQNYPWSVNDHLHNFLVGGFIPDVC